LLYYLLDLFISGCTVIAMQPNTQNPNIVTKKPSTGSSKTGAVLSILALILSGIGYGLIHADYSSREPLNGTAEQVGDKVASGTVHVFSSLIGVPFLAVSIFLGILAIIFVIIRLTKVKGTGLVFSILWILLSAWAIKIAIASFSIIKAH
jgi:hypothetical protein